MKEHVTRGGVHFSENASGMMEQSFFCSSWLDSYWLFRRFVEEKQQRYCHNPTVTFCWIGMLFAVLLLLSGIFCSVWRQGQIKCLANTTCCTILIVWNKESGSSVLSG
jgi:hypothetical protein